MVPSRGSAGGGSGGTEPLAGDYAERLLADLAAEPVPAGEAAVGLHPDLEWARSGAMALTGYPDRAPLLAPAPLALCAERAVRAFRVLAGPGPPAVSGGLDRLDGAALLGEHAAAFGFQRRGDVSPGGSCRLLRAADGHLALNIARPDDFALLPAWLGSGEVVEPWSYVRARVAERGVDELVERGRLMGLPVAPAGPAPEDAPPWHRVAALGKSKPPEPGRLPLVVDLSSLWAGPLCAHLLGLAGARVIKVESIRRPDGARRGRSDFYDLLNGGKQSVALDLASDVGRRRLQGLVAAADIVVEATRPRALAQLGIDAEALVAERPGITWVGITGYGR
ncbi:MAG: CoA transferase, partial [Deltaproteobacteria bacterium]|nr:CoA transferase [Deltaproteobacteria bacterium]